MLHALLLPRRMCLQAKALGDVLVVGLIPDSEILRCKGPPVLNERERYLLVDAVKWVDEVVKGTRGGAGVGCTAAVPGVSRSSRVLVDVLCPD